MLLFKLSQSYLKGYDTFDSCIVCADDIRDALTMSPAGGRITDEMHQDYHEWPSNSMHINCEYIGDASPDQKKGIVLSSFNAG